MSGFEVSIMTSAETHYSSIHKVVKYESSKTAIKRATNLSNKYPNSLIMVREQVSYKREGFTRFYVNGVEHTDKDEAVSKADFTPHTVNKFSHDDNQFSVYERWEYHTTAWLELLYQQYGNDKSDYKLYRSITGNKVQYWRNGELITETQADEVFKQAAIHKEEKAKYFNVKGGYTSTRVLAHNYYNTSSLTRDIKYVASDIGELVGDSKTATPEQRDALARIQAAILKAVEAEASILNSK